MKLSHANRIALRLAFIESRQRQLRSWTPEELEEIFRWAECTLTDYNKLTGVLNGTIEIDLKDSQIQTFKSNAEAFDSL